MNGWGVVLAGYLVAAAVWLVLALRVHRARSRPR
jgi:hypothetical protein